MTIELLSTNQRDAVGSLLGELFDARSKHNQPESQMVNHILALWSAGELEILGKLDDSKKLLGIVVLSIPSNRLSFIHIGSSKTGLDKNQVHKYERELFDEGFARLKENESWVTSGGSSWLSQNLIDHALEVGFKKYDNIGMSASRNTLKDLEIPPTPSGYSLETYDNRWKSKVSQLFFDCLKDSTECNAEPDLLSSPARCENLVHETVNNNWGDFKDGQYSWVLKFNGEIVGVSLFTIVNNDTGYGVGMCLDHEHRRKGLGRLLFIHSLVTLLDAEPNVQIVSQATSSMNTALPLYESLGFQEISRHSLYTWVKED